MTNTLPPIWKYIAWSISAISIAIACIAVSNNSSKYLTWDEVDYADATKLGVIANCAEQGSLSWKQFYQLILAKKKGDENAIESLGKTLPPEEYDPIQLRHLHPPGPILFWSLFQHLFSSDPSYIVSKWCMPLLFAIVLLFSLKLANKLNAKYILLSAVFLAIILTAEATVESFSRMNFHSFHMMICLPFLAFLIRFFDQPSKWNEFYIACGIALLFWTLEMAIVIVGGFMLLLATSKQTRSLIFWKPLFRIGGYSLLLIFILWPGAFMNGAYAKTLANYAFRLIMQSNAEYARVSMMGVWMEISIKNFWLLGFNFFTVILHIVYFRKIAALYRIILLAGITYCFIITPFILSHYYVLPGLCIWAFSGILTTAHLLSATSDAKGLVAFRFMTIASAFILVVQSMLILNFTRRAELQVTDKNTEDDLKYISSLDMTNPILANGSHFLNYYLGKGNYIELERFSLVNPDFYIRENYVYKDINQQVKDGEYATLIIMKWMEYKPEKLATLETFGYNKKELNDFIVFTRRE